jgi:hypothetical protein
LLRKLKIVKSDSLSQRCEERPKEIGLALR